MTQTVRIGTRSSALALVQSEWVAEQLRRLHPQLLVELVRISTRGDRIRDVALSLVGGKGLFVKEIEAALLNGTIDVAVHSMKDLPTELAEGLCLAAVPVRADPRDALVLPQGAQEAPRSAAGSKAFRAWLPDGAVVGTSSLRRQAQLLHLRPDVAVRDLRGNVDTRLRKLDEGRYEAVILAAAGLNRLDRGRRISLLLQPPEWLPAVGQGALALECRTDDAATRALMEPLTHRETSTTVAAERSFLAALDGGCQVPLGAFCELTDKGLRLHGFVSEPTGQRLIRDQVTTASVEQGAAESLGRRLAEALLAAGGAEILAAVRAQTGEDDR